MDLGISIYLINRTVAYSNNHCDHGQRHHFETGGRKQYCEQSEQKFYWFVTFWGTLGRNAVQKICQINLFGGSQFGGQLPHVPLPSYMCLAFTVNTQLRDSIIGLHTP